MDIIESFMWAYDNNPEVRVAIVQENMQQVAQLALQFDKTRFHKKICDGYCIVEDNINGSKIIVLVIVSQESVANWQSVTEIWYPDDMQWSKGKDLKNFVYRFSISCKRKPNVSAFSQAPKPVPDSSILEDDDLNNFLSEIFGESVV